MSELRVNFSATGPLHRKRINGTGESHRQVTQLTKVEVKRVGVVSVFKIYLILGVILGIILGLLLIPILPMAPTTPAVRPGGYPTGLLPLGGLVGGILLGILYGIVASIAGVIGAILYNLAAKVVGGIELDLEEKTRLEY